MNQTSNAKVTDPEWSPLYQVGGVAALLAGILFRRNLAAEIGLFMKPPSPAAIREWFTLLQHDRLLGLTYLNIFDVVNYILVGLMFLALYAVLHNVHKSYMTIAVVAGIVGITVYLASNTAFSMLSLSAQYATASTQEQKTVLLAAGQALLALNRFSNGAHPGSGGYISLLFVATAGLIMAIVMLRSTMFNRITAYVGILATLLDLAYCIAYVSMPAAGSDRLAIYFIPAAGLFLMIWHIMVGWSLYQVGKKAVSK